ncbi:uncharacterized protein [Petaurus breviceps papuanus]|uniref:uncharacterized protein n=1 Tax=Petaurus breviceps papuanus TaxID=3040969 RepID=UPI0036DDF59C
MPETPYGIGAPVQKETHRNLVKTPARMSPRTEGVTDGLHPRQSGFSLRVKGDFQQKVKKPHVFGDFRASLCSSPRAHSQKVTAAPVAAPPRPLRLVLRPKLKVGKRRTMRLRLLGVALGSAGYAFTSHNRQVSLFSKSYDSPFLQEAEVHYIPRNTCNSEESYDEVVPYTSFCAGEEDGSVDACMGDSGGPLMCNIPESGRYFLMGITSFGFGCGKKHFPGVYTGVQFYKMWINNVLLLAAAEDTNKIKGVQGKIMLIVIFIILLVDT